ncbi:MAG TPA: hypothetical protein VNY31_08880 [Solirubrobacteraceae bacterium]|jgi:DNA modification methylase|nr:hypothetical protein [Solirubrobacteraceae bacterium]
MASRPAQPKQASGAPTARASCARRAQSSPPVRRRRAARWRINHADCLKALPRLAADSIDAIVTDPPYGLEFMGRHWDRLGDVGQASHAGFTGEPGFERFATYSASANLRCQRCKRWRWAKPGHRCDCGPDAVWPNVRALEGRRMQE